jgi:FKBP-type peptidyl-prolyl cis-trans isomerase FkpA
VTTINAEIAEHADKIFCGFSGFRVDRCGVYNRSPMDNITSLQISDGKVGTGAAATAGKQVSVHYTGWLYDPKTADHHGKKFDSSRDHGEPFSFKLGAGTVIRGWDQGVAGMKVGGTRTLVIPSELGYGARGAGGAIPPNATLLFDVELLDVK